MLLYEGLLKWESHNKHNGWGFIIRYLAAEVRSSNFSFSIETKIQKGKWKNASLNLCHKTTTPLVMGQMISYLVPVLSFAEWPWTAGSSKHSLARLLPLLISTTFKITWYCQCGSSGIQNWCDFSLDRVKRDSYSKLGHCKIKKWRNNENHELIHVGPKLQQSAEGS